MAGRCGYGNPWWRGGHRYANQGASATATPVVRDSTTRDCVPVTPSRDCLGRVDSHDCVPVATGVSGPVAGRILVSVAFLGIGSGSG